MIEIQLAKIRLTTSFPTKSASWGALISFQASWTGAWWVQSIVFQVQLRCCNRSGGNSLSVLSFGDGEDIKKCRPLGSPCMNCIKVSILIISWYIEHPVESRLNRFWKVQTGQNELRGRLAAKNHHFFGSQRVNIILMTKSTIILIFCDKTASIIEMPAIIFSASLQ